jgi:hypothetical protein
MRNTEELRHNHDDYIETLGLELNHSVDASRSDSLLRALSECQHETERIISGIINM